MIDKILLKQVVEKSLEGTGLMLIDLTVNSSNEICVELDSADGVDIDSCARLTRVIEEAFDRDVEDYQLEVGSSGLTSPFKVHAQYAWNIGHDVEVLTRDGRKLHGVLSAVEDGAPLDTDVRFTIEVPVKVKEPGVKKPVIKQEAVNLNSGECKYVRCDLKF